jgi:hypothetical protein
MQGQAAVAQTAKTESQVPLHGPDVLMKSIAPMQ